MSAIGGYCVGHSCNSKINNPSLQTRLPQTKKDSRREACLPKRSLQRRRRRRRLAMVGRLFVRVGEREQTAFVPGTAKNRQARGERAVASEAHLHVDRGKTCRRRLDLDVCA